MTPGEECLVDSICGERAAPDLFLVFLSHARPHVRDQQVGSVCRFLWRIRHHYPIAAFRHDIGGRAVT